MRERTRDEDTTGSTDRCIKVILLVKAELEVSLLKILLVWRTKNVSGLARMSNGLIKATELL